MSGPRVERSDGFWISAAPEDGLQRVATSTQIRDRNDRLIIQAGWELANYRANPTVLWAHNSDRLPVGTAPRIEIGEHGGVPALISDIAFLDATEDRFAAKVGRLMAAGKLPAVSAGWVGIETITASDEEGAWIGTDFLKSELLEQSVVPVPANPASLKMAAELEMHREELQLVFTDIPTDVVPAIVTVDLGAHKPPTETRVSAAFRAKVAVQQARVRALNRTTHRH